MKKIKILFPFAGKTLGGSHISSLMLIKNLSKKKYETLVLVHEKGALTNYLKKYKIKFIKTKNLNRYYDGNLIKVFFLILKYKSIIKNLKIDIVHTQDMTMHLTWLFACKISRIHHIWHQRTKTGKKIILMAHLSSYFICISNFIKQNLPKSLINKSKLIYNPFLEEKKIKYKRELNILNIILIANLQKRKRVDVAIKIIAKLKKVSRFNVNLKIFGEKRKPIYLELIKLVKKYDVQDNIKFMGLRFPIRPWISNSDIMLVTAENEAFGRSIVEAMSLGVPVVASDDGGPKEVIENKKNGFLIKLEDVDGYVETILNIKKNIKLKKMITKNAKKTVKRFSLKNHLAKINEVYNELLTD